MKETNVDEGIPLTIDGGVELQDLAMGEIGEKFPGWLKEVAANILDFQCSGKVAREINIKLKFTPSDDRTHASVEIGGVVKLAPTKPADTKLYFTPVGRAGGTDVVISED